MPAHTLPAPEAIARISRFDAIIDARTPDEFALDRIPGAVNWPTLDNAQRIEIGTLYKHDAHQARKRGAVMAARNIAAHIERELMDKARGWKPLVYCWRGGQRSGALAAILSAAGFHVTLIEGGYKAFRKVVIEDTPALAQRLTYRVICGPTGSGKTRLLHALTTQGAQVLDLEALARHRASVLGLIPGQPQPSQKAFETAIWHALRQLDPARPVFVEAESKKVGNCSVPEALIDALRASRCLHLQLPLPERVALLLEDYPHFVQDADFFCQRLDALTPLRGKATVQAWKAQIQTGQTATVVQELLAHHYDPGYADSTARNFTQFERAQPIAPANRTPQAMRALAETLGHIDN